MTKYILHYFDARGRAEIIRLLFALSNVTYTDKRFTFDDWPAIKTNTLLGQAPYLEIDDFVLPQSLAIVRYVTRETNLYGTNNLESSQVDAFLETYSDGLNAYFTKIRAGKSFEEAGRFAVQFFQDDAKKHLDNLEKLVQLWSVNEKYSVGNNLTVADIAIFDFATYSPIGQSIAESLPGLKRIINNVNENPRIAAYLKSRPVTPW